jgi:hypothetical protein
LAVKVTVGNVPALELSGELFDADEIRSFHQDDIINLVAQQRAEILRELVALGRRDHRCASSIRWSPSLSPHDLSGWEPGEPSRRQGSCCRNPRADQEVRS